MIQTVIVQSNINVGGLAPGQQAEVEDSPKTRELLDAGFWTLLVPATPATRPARAKAVTTVDSESAEPSGDDLPGLPD